MDGGGEEREKRERIFIAEISNSRLSWREQIVEKTKMKELKRRINKLPHSFDYNLITEVVLLISLDIIIQLISFAS